MSAPPEPRNPFYLLLLIVGLIFIATVLAYAIVPVLEEKARNAGADVPPREESWFRNALHNDGWKWVLIEVALLVILGLLSMGLDRWRRWKLEHAELAKEKEPSTNAQPEPRTQ
jgi:membrane-associated PAP2 superfamily phosphatase